MAEAVAAQLGLAREGAAVASVARQHGAPATAGLGGAAAAASGAGGALPGAVLAGTGSDQLQPDSLEAGTTAGLVGQRRSASISAARPGGANDEEGAAADATLGQPQAILDARLVTGSWASTASHRSPSRPKAVLCVAPTDLAAAAAAIGEASALARACRAMRRDRCTAHCSAAPGVTLLHIAARSLSPDCLKVVIGSDAQRGDPDPRVLDVRDPDGRTPLHWAARAGSWKCVEFICRRMALPSPSPQADAPRVAGAEEAAAGGTVEGPTAGVCAAMALASASLAATDRHQMTPLHEAAFHGQAKAACVLLMCGASTNSKDANKRTPLAYACQAGNVETVQLLLVFAERQGSLNVNARDADGRTPLHEAAAYGRTAVASLLLAQAASATLGDRRKQTQIMSALASRALRTALVLCASVSARICGLPRPGKALPQMERRAAAPASSAVAAGTAELRAGVRGRGSARGLFTGIRRALARTAATQHAGDAKTSGRSSGAPTSGPAVAASAGRAPAATHASPRPQQDAATSLRQAASMLPVVDLTNWRVVVAPAATASAPAAMRIPGSPAAAQPGTSSTAAGTAVEGGASLSRSVEAALRLAACAATTEFAAWETSALEAFVADHSGPEMAAVYGRQRDKRGWCLSHFAASAGCLPVLKAAGRADIGLLSAVKPTCRQSVVHDACINNRLACLKYLLRKRVPAGGGDKTGDTPLHWTAFRGFRECAVELLEHGHGVDVSQLNNDQGTALHSAANNGDAVLGQLLLRAGCDPDQPLADGNRPVHNCAFEGHTEFLTMLLESRCNIFLTNNMGRTVLHEAASNGHVGVMRMLLTFLQELPGPDRQHILDAPDSRGDTALHWAVCKNHAESAHALLEAGASRDVTNESGGTVLHAAVDNHSISCLKLLLLWRFDPNSLTRVAATGAEVTVLMVAAEKGDAEAIQLLLDFQADPSAVSDSGWTALHGACSAHETRAAEILIEGGARLDLLDDSGRPPLGPIRRMKAKHLLAAIGVLGDDAIQALASVWSRSDVAAWPPLRGAPATSTPSDAGSSLPGHGPHASSRASSSKLPGLARAVSDPWTSASLAPAPHHWRGFAAFFRDEMFADVRLKSRDGRAVPAHRVVLAARCPTLAAMLSSGLMESTQRTICLDVSGEVLAALTQHIYGTELHVPSSLGTVGDICVAAGEYQLRGLVVDVEVAVIKGLVPETLASAFVLAKEHGMMLLEAACIHLACTAAAGAAFQKVLDRAATAWEAADEALAGASSPLRLEAEAEAVSNLLHATLRQSKATILRVKPYLEQALTGAEPGRQGAGPVVTSDPGMASSHLRAQRPRREPVDPAA